MLTALSILCPPAAVLATGQPRDAAKTAGLTLLFFIPGVIHAWRAVERYTVARQYEMVLRELELRDRLAGV